MTSTFQQLHFKEVALANAKAGVLDPACKRAIMAELYADLIMSGNKEWHDINIAITKRWPRGLVYIKTEAWKIVKAGR